MKNVPHDAGRRAVLCAGVLALAGALPLAPIAHAEPTSGFSDFVQSLWPLAQAQGISREIFDAAIDGLTLDPATPGSASKQPEFDKPLSAYVAQAVNPARIARGRQEAETWSRQLAEIERRFGLPAEICLAAWGMETDFGRGLGTHDVLRTLVSLAYQRSDRALFTDEFIAALVMVGRGVPRAKLKGSWAGAMGNPQFLPSAYLKYAVAFDGTGPADIWASEPDSLASIAHFLQASGWQPGLPWGMEVLLPASYEFASLHMPFEAWARQGVQVVNGSALPLQGDATLFFPAGAGGPAFLLSANYWILKVYNNSDSYALSLALLADRIAGGSGLQTAWPAHETTLSRSDKAEMQKLLRAQGLYDGSVDGRFGPASRDAIHEFQRAAGLHPADGYGTAVVLQALRSWQGMR